MSAAGPLEYVRQNREKLAFFGYFFLMLGLAVPLSQMIVRAWDHGGDGNLLRTLFHLPTEFGVEPAIVQAVAIGLFLGFLVLLTVDPKKRWQGVLLWLGVGVAFLFFVSVGFVPRTFNRLGLTAPWLVLGLALGILAGGGRMLVEAALNGIHSVGQLEFRHAARRLFQLVAVVTIAFFLEYHVQYPGFTTFGPEGVVLDSGTVGFRSKHVVVDAVATVGFLGVMHRFIQYDADRHFIVLGPEQSGKSMFLLGAYLEALNREEDSQTPMEPTNDLMEMVDNFDQSRGWAIEGTTTGTLKELAFQYVHGVVFPKNIRVSSPDYAGEYLSDIPDALLAPPGDIDDSVLVEITRQIELADTMVLIIDVERFVENEGLSISDYFDLINVAREKDVLLVATKADHLAEEFREQENLDPYQYFEDFEAYVNDRLMQSETVRALTQEAGGAEIHPVYFETEVTDDGQRIPKRDADNSVVTVGFEHILEEFAN